jgi:hypothetical protein
MLGPGNDAAAALALATYPGGFQVGPCALPNFCSRLEHLFASAVVALTVL